MFNLSHPIILIENLNILRNWKEYWNDLINGIRVFISIGFNTFSLIILATGDVLIASKVISAYNWTYSNIKLPIFTIFISYFDNKSYS